MVPEMRDFRRRNVTSNWVTAGGGVLENSGVFRFFKL